MSSFSHREWGEVYNIGGGRHSNASMLEAIEQCQQVCGKELDWQYTETNRVGDHMWWISDNGKFANHFPGWRQRYDVDMILREIFEENRERWTRGAPKC